MKFLLTAINAKYIHSNLAVYDMKSYAQRYEEQIEIAEYTINHQQSEILRELYLKQPTVIGFSCYIWNIRMVEELMGELHKILPDLEIWLGGPEVSYRAREFMEAYPYVRGIMIGEGEKTFLQLMQFYVQGDILLSAIPGICYRDEHNQLQYQEPVGMMDLSEIPFPYRSPEQFENRIVYYESSRGCPFSCSYCLSSVEKKLRFRDIVLVKRELQFFIDRKVPQVKFVDRTFNCKQGHALEIWKYLVCQDNGITNFHFEIAADLLKEEELALMHTMRPGLIQLEIGVQSTNPDTLRAIHRRMNLEQLKQTVARIQEGRNIHQHLDLIAGLPYEDYSSFGNSFNEVYEMNPDQLQLGFLKVLSGTVMHEKCGEYGIVYQDNPPYEVLYTKWLTFEEVLKLKGIEEMVEQYYNSSQFTHSIQLLEPCFGGAFAMYEALADFYQQEHRPGVKHSRLKQYEILLRFAQKQFQGEALSRFQEAMVYDVYLRENAKTRPFFAAERESYKEWIKNFCMEEERNRSYLPDYKEYNSRQIANMVHIERFTKFFSEETYVVFDYKNRNILTKEARTIFIR